MLLIFLRSFATNLLQCFYRQSFSFLSNSRVNFFKSKVSFTRILLTLDKMRSLLKEGSAATKRELYYQNVNEYGTQVR